MKKNLYSIKLNKYFSRIQWWWETGQYKRLVLALKHEAEEPTGDVARPLGSNDMFTVFFMLAFGLLLATLIVGIEMIAKKIGHKNKELISK